MSEETRPKTQITDLAGRNVAANVRRIREAHGWSTYDLARKLKEAGRPISPSAVAKVEREERRVDAGDLVALAVVLNVNPSALLLPRDDSPSTIVDLMPGRHTDGGEVRMTADRLWSWADGQGPLFDHPDAAATLQTWRDFIQHARPARRGLYEMEALLRDFRLKDEEGTADGPSVD
ncbi:helix-turn-helix domain-containing protein [Streptomyces tendae]|uniref:helix-turn-helix domain-containing protein n=1 Tax=Streptomyces tendae TaxID=1932 RepID=UPI003D75D6FA